MAEQTNVIIEVDMKTVASPTNAILDRVKDAARQGRQVELVLEGTSIVYDAQELAEYLGFPELLEDVVDEQASKRETNEAVVLQRALRIQDAPTKARRLIQVGRHPRSDILMAQYAIPGGHEVEFVTPSGDVKKRRV